MKVVLFFIGLMLLSGCIQAPPTSSGGIDLPIEPELSDDNNSIDLNGGIFNLTDDKKDFAPEVFDDPKGKTCADRDQDMWPYGLKESKSYYAFCEECFNITYETVLCFDEEFYWAFAMQKPSNTIPYGKKVYDEGLLDIPDPKSKGGVIIDIN